MDHFLEIKVLPDPEFTAADLLNALFAKLHRALGQRGRGDIGVSFPDAGKVLGEKIRLHGSSPALTELQSTTWLKGLRDYTQISDIQPVPEGAKFRTVQRIQVKSSALRLRRRSVNKGWLTEQQAAERIPFTCEKRTNLPYLQLKSLSSGEMFRLFISQGPLQDTPAIGTFSSYGLSATATVPWF
ncbi:MULTISPECIES: type I-F CRISPR-associated endoribonuclease Cas6/Csy4 [unclassified Brenneria]|uniref:type I-F CRISPR-associated endoribonuclease Cas6/Csy4 n=1 Tax=unclassified Brenneria TaxID=2634434 RepID=UPI0029C4D9BE|nr:MULTISPECIES: type I-F CRISPR-associated endoribonuclease Cas6/Csy4 [unclassified Brenneria]MDX5628744.1 type I-F CRISPR-associated endoribonuclease Cas6/Csy4 [Brenneria sp. L3-3Z]MDX5695883.1 type I-F CRISPR-associated endoribonuclease Cas6/Csy4 [Brenneria sp. L4-2C]MEE3661172.1 type I-F CRISPR-associated endoribonuclease Cas6/Csy4 [Brenneria sp. g21c3]